MSQSKSGRKSVAARAPSLMLSTLGGMVFFLLFAASSSVAAIQSPMLQRYMLGHSINRLTTAMFFVGVFSLLVASLAVWRQRRQLTSIRLRGEVSEPRNIAANEREAESAMATTLLAKLACEPQNTRGHYLRIRLTRLLQLIERDGAGPATERRMQQLAEEDLDRMSERYSLARILVWAMPLLGFLGTVLGISEAMGSLDVGADSNLQQMMSGLQSNLNVAFDTTAQALVLSIMTMFGVFAIERSETELLAQVNTIAEEEICQWFDFAEESPASGLSTDGVGQELVRALVAELDSLDRRRSAELAALIETAGGGASRIVETSLEKFTREWESALKAQTSVNQEASRQGLETVSQLTGNLTALLADTKKNFAGISRKPEADPVAGDPRMSHRIESALLQLTTVLAEIERSANVRRERRDDLHPATIPIDRMDRNRKAA